MYQIVKWFLAAAATLVILLAPAAQAQEVVVNFNEAEIQAVIDDVSVVTGNRFIVDPNVRGRVTIISQEAMDADQYFQVFLSTMRVHGYTVVPTVEPNTFQIVPEQNGARSVSPVNQDIRGDRFVTRVIRLDHTSHRDALNVLRPMVSPQGSINATESGNTLVIVDNAENVNRLREVVRELDQDRSIFEMVELENVSAAEMVRIIQTVRDRENNANEDPVFNVTVASIPASNTVLLRGYPSAVSEMARLVRQVDGVSQSNQSFRVIRLDHADGEELLPILQQVAETFSAAESANRIASVSYHAPTNSLVINADPDIQREMERVVDQLDVRRPQVLVEGIIVEISDTTAEELGVQLLLTGGENSDSPLLMTRYSTSSPDLLALSGALAEAGTDTTTTALEDAALASLLGVQGAAIGFGGQNSDGTLFGLVLNAVEADADSNVLATPSILAMDNEEASFLSGQEIPVTTGEVLGSDNSNPFRTVEREEVGVKLIVRPQITEGDTVRLYIEQEVSSVAGTVTTDSTDLITNKRAIQTTVLADNGEIIVLGGLIEQDEQQTVTGVPGLANVPAVGRLFRNETENTTRRNLMIFIRPTIIRNEADMQAVTQNRYNYIRGEQTAADPDGNSSLEALVNMLMVDLPDAETGDDR